MGRLRRTKSNKQAVERLVPFAKAIGFRLKYTGNGYWHERYLPAEKRYGDEGPLRLKSDQVLGGMAHWIREMHPEAETLRQAVRWYGKGPHQLDFRYREALEWLRLKGEEL